MGCTTRTRRCEATEDPGRETPGCCRAQILRVTREVAHILDVAAIPWWLDYGALLGWRLGETLYWNDKDTDLNVLVDDRDRTRAALDPLRFRGRHVRYWPPSGREYAWGDVIKTRISRWNRNNCDITFWRCDGAVLTRDNWSAVDRFKGRETPADWIFPTVRATLEGIPVNVPRETDRVLAHRYGAGWRDLPAVRHLDEERSDGYGNVA